MGEGYHKKGCSFINFSELLLPLTNISWGKALPWGSCSFPWPPFFEHVSSALSNSNSNRRAQCWRSSVQPESLRQLLWSPARTLGQAHSRGLRQLYPLLRRTLISFSCSAGACFSKGIEVTRQPLLTSLRPLISPALWRQIPS